MTYCSSPGTFGTSRKAASFPATASACPRGSSPASGDAIDLVALNRGDIDDENAGDDQAHENEAGNDEADDLFHKGGLLAVFDRSTVARPLALPPPRPRKAMLLSSRFRASWSAATMLAELPLEVRATTRSISRSYGCTSKPSSRISPNFDTVRKSRSRWNHGRAKPFQATSPSSRHKSTPRPAPWPCASTSPILTNASSPACLPAGKCE